MMRIMCLNRLSGLQVKSIVVEKTERLKATEKWNPSESSLISGLEEGCSTYSGVRTSRTGFFEINKIYGKLFS